MADLADFKSWLKQLECPESYSTNYVINTLQKGVLGLIWENTPYVIRPCTEVLEVRKNILFYKLKHEPRDVLIQNVKNTVHLRNERNRLDTKIKEAEEKWKQQEFMCQQKIHLLNKKKTDVNTFDLKEKILQIKYQQIQEQIQDCAKMYDICNHLLPPIIEEISQKTIVECLLLVGNYSSGPGKRKIWNKIAELLTPVKISLLWNALLQVRSYYTDLLIHLDIEENDEKKANEKMDNVDVAISKLCSEHLDNVAMRFIHNGRIKSNEEKTLSCVQKIDQVIEKQRSYLNDWLPLTLEVYKLEILHNEMEKELEIIEEQLPKDTTTIIEDDSLEQLTSEIKTIDVKTANCVQEIKLAFVRLQSSGTLITKTKECLVNELKKLYLLQQTTNEQNNNWHNIDPSYELVVFNNEIDFGAFKKIMLKGNLGGTHQHLKMCHNQAFTVIDARLLLLCNKKCNLSTKLPMLRVPIYYLVDLYRTFVNNAILNNIIINQDNHHCAHDENFLESLQHLSTKKIAMNPHGITQLLKLNNATMQRVQQNITEFDLVLKTWSNQTVREVVERIFGQQIVYGYNLDEWQKRFDKIVYILQKSNVNYV